MFNIPKIDKDEKLKWYRALSGKQVTCGFTESEDGWVFCVARDNGLTYILDMEIIPEDKQPRLNK